MREWVLENGLATQSLLDEIQAQSKELAKQSRDTAWRQYIQPVKEQVVKAVTLITELSQAFPEQAAVLQAISTTLQASRDPLRREVMKALYQSIECAGDHPHCFAIKDYYNDLLQENQRLYNSYLYDQGPKSALNVPAVAPVYASDAPSLNGFEIINRYFDKQFSINEKLVAFGEDLGQIGDVNQGFSGLQEKHGKERIFDTGIRELTIMGSGIGMALRGLRPIAEIQYLDYLLYGLQPLSDDVATVHYRTAGRQSCPLIVRTRGHRLEGIWHSGSPMGMIINSLRGIHVCVPRNMTQAAGMYNTLLRSNDPGLVIECLNGYRLKEKLPSNLDSFTVALGVPEVIHPGSDVTIVSYGSTLRVIAEAVHRLEQVGISCELIDVQTLLPFDLHHHIVDSLKKTNRILFVDEDVPGGAAAYMYNKVMEEQGGYKFLDVAPRTITAKPHRPAYGSDGDYFSKPNAEEIEKVVKEMMAE
jgi:pyruvate/2-oxoglutarate/acetoin dehydrogenase E1 component